MPKYGVYGTSSAVEGQPVVVVYSFGPHYTHKRMGLGGAVPRQVQSLSQKKLMEGKTKYQEGLLWQLSV